MKHLIVLLLLTTFITSCKKETNQNLIDFRCGDFESVDCFNQNWIPDIQPTNSIVGNSYNGTNCLQLITDSVTNGQTIYTYMTGFDSTKVYRITLYAKYKDASPQHGYSIDIHFYPFYSSTQIVRADAPSSPINRDWEKYTVLFQPPTNAPEKFMLSVYGIDTTWIDDIQIGSY